MSDFKEEEQTWEGEAASNNTDNHDDMLASSSVGDGDGAGGGGPSDNNSNAPSSSSSDNNAPVTVAMLEFLRKRLEEQFQQSFRSQRLQLKKVEEKSDAALEKLPLLDTHTQELSRLEEQLKAEKSWREQLAQAFTHTVEKLMEEIVQLSLKITVLEGELAERNGKGEEQSPPLPPPSPVQETSIPSSSSSSSSSSEGTQNLGESSSVSVAPPPRTGLIFTVEDLTVRRGEREEVAQNVVVIHQKAHRPGRKHPYPCLCGKEFPTRATLSEHIIGHQESMEGELQELISKSAESIPDRDGSPIPSSPASNNGSHPGSAVNQGKVKPGGGKRHERDPKRPLFCVCGLRYRTVANLYDHLRYFTGKELLWCRRRGCGKGFVYASLLKRHMSQAHQAQLRLARKSWEHLASDPATNEEETASGEATNNILIPIKMEPLLEFVEPEGDHNMESEDNPNP